MKVYELIEELAEFDPEKEIAVTWEGTVDRDFTIYESADSIVLIDSDDGFYRSHFQTIGIRDTDFR